MECFPAAVQCCQRILHRCKMQLLRSPAILQCAKTILHHCNSRVDRGDGKGFVFLAEDTVPGYTDTAALPASGASAVWKYKGIYREADVQVGQWSDVVSTPVMG